MNAMTKLAERRQELGMSQKALGAAVEVSSMTVSRWERGQNTPRPKVWPKLAQVMDKPIAELLGIGADPQESEHA